MDKEDAVLLTVGGESATGALEAEGIQWYKVTLESKKEYKFVLKSDDHRIAVGVIFSVYLDKGERQSLMWQRHYDPDDFLRMSSENEVNLPDIEDILALVKNKKQLAIESFLAPEAGTYFISVEGYINTEGNDQENSYAYTDTFVYSVAVKYADTPYNPQGAEIPVKVQSANVPYVNNMIEAYETVYHTVSLKQGVTYQVQARPSDAYKIAGPVWFDQYGNYLGEMLYLKAPYKGTYLVGIAGDLYEDEFGYIEYGLRVQEDDYGNSDDDATKIDVGDTIKGYLGQYDSDWFVVTIPGRPEAQDGYKKYEVTIAPNRFNLSGIGFYEDAYMMYQGSDEIKYRFTPSVKDDYSYFDGTPDGAGAYEISIKEVTD